VRSWCGGARRRTGTQYYSARSAVSISRDTYVCLDFSAGSLPSNKISDVGATALAAAFETNTTLCTVE
jgi:hypothetical protein